MVTTTFLVKNGASLLLQSSKQGWREAVERARPVIKWSAENLIEGANDHAPTSESSGLEPSRRICNRGCTERFPKEERYGLTSQIRRAAISIPANIAEGAGRRSTKEFIHFLSNSQGSASELETELIIANRLGYLDETTFARLISDLERIGRLITGLSRQLKRRDLI